MQQVDSCVCVCVLGCQAAPSAAAGNSALHLRGCPETGPFAPSKQMVLMMQPSSGPPGQRQSFHHVLRCCLHAKDRPNRCGHNRRQQLFQQAAFLTRTAAPAAAWAARPSRGGTRAGTAAPPRPALGPTAQMNPI